MDGWKTKNKLQYLRPGYQQHRGIKSPANCETQRDLSGRDRLNLHCVNKFCKGLDAKEVNLFVKVSHCRFNMESLLWSASVYNRMKHFGVFNFFVLRKKKKVPQFPWEEPYSHKITICDGILEFLFHTEYWLTYVLLSSECNMVFGTCMLVLAADFDPYRSNKS